ncbi:MAG TPA: CotH kinase family protein [Verrucomicrobiota bacterium]|nr:CotH kinase family protein [Verrucomicrobiota bacterium]
MGVQGQGLEISEFLAINDGGLEDEDGAHPDWIEVHNPGMVPVDLGGWHLTDDARVLLKWTFPATNLAAGGYMVVFASGKDRATPGRPLHTNFKLDGAGEYLALVAPGGAPVVSEFAPVYPDQRANVSAGPTGGVSLLEVLPAGSPVWWHVPEDGVLGLSWIEPGFAGVSWAEGRTALGYDAGGPGALVLSVDFNDRTTDLVEPGFAAFTLDSVGGGGAIQYAPVTRDFGGVRVTVTPVGGVGLDDRVRQTPVAGGGFTESALLRDFIFATDLTGNGGLDVEISGLVAGRDYQVELWSFDTGSVGRRVSNWSINGERFAELYTFDGSVLPGTNERYRMVCTAAADAAGRLWIEARRDSSCTSYGVFLNALRICSSAFGADVRTDTEAAMAGRNASVCVRLPFAVADAGSVTGGVLRMRYDDGFVAWINGVEIGRRNAPDVLRWDSAATAVGADPGGSGFEAIEWPAELVVEGANVLAIQGLNVSADDADFLLMPTLEIRTASASSVSFFKNPTPGSANGLGSPGWVAAPRPSVGRGVLATDAGVSFECATAGAEIRYTLDGCEPTAATGFPYTGPIHVSGTTVLRARGFRAGWIPSVTETVTYLDLGEIAGQPAAPSGWPLTWGMDSEVDAQDGAGNGTVPADYEMDPNVVTATRPGYGVDDALRTLPFVAVTMDPEDFLGAAAGIYSHPLSSGSSWEKACAIEYLPRDAEGGDGFLVPAGIRIHGGSSRRPYRLQKHGFRLAFRGEYGASRLDHDLFPGCGVTTFDRLVLRPFFTDGWALVSWDPARYRPDDSVCFRDVWIRDSLRAMGHPSSASLFVHVTVNGLYWGVYNLSERIDERFCAGHFGGRAEDYDVLADFNELKAGQRVAWDAVQSMAAAGLQSAEAYAAFSEQVDVVNLADYVLLHLFADCEDWPHHNWVAVRNRVVPGARWRFLAWDQEIALDNHGINRTAAKHAGTPSALFQALRGNAEFRLLFADRVQRHLSEGGALSLEASRSRWTALAGVLDKAIVAESARWGDTADETPYGNTESRPGVPVKREYTREADWLPAVEYVSDVYLPSLFEEANDYAILNELGAAGLLASVAAPSLSVRGGFVPGGTLLEIGAASGTIFVTTDGSDPRRAVTGDPQGAPYAGPLTITEPVILRARVRGGTGEWSALTEAGFVTGVEPAGENLVIVGVRYRSSGAAGGTGTVELTWTRPVAGDGAVIGIEGSEDLREWSEIESGIERVPGVSMPGGLWLETWRLLGEMAGTRYYRVGVRPRVREEML